MRHIIKRHRPLNLLLHFYGRTSVLRKPIHIYLLSLLGFTLTACSSAHLSVSNSFEFYPDDNNGLVIVSTRLIDNCGQVGNFLPRIFKVGGSPFGRPLNVKNALIKPDIIEPPGQFYVQEYEAGKYTLGNISVTGLTLPARHSENPAMLQFTVRAREAVYIGELEFTISKGCGMVWVNINNHWKRDKFLFRERIEKISPDSVSMRLAIRK